MANCAEASGAVMEMEKREMNRNVSSPTKTFGLMLVLLVTGLGRAQTVTNIISFTGNNSLGAPSATPAQGHNAELYGTSNDPQGASGSVFSLTAGGAATVLYAFNYTTGANPSAGVTLATDGNFYGTTGGGGTLGYGVLYRVSPSGTFTVLHNFSGSDGAGPGAAPIEASDGNFYGTTSGDNGNSTVYKYTRSGAFTNLYTFDSTHGRRVQAALLQGSDGNLYGTAVEGGVNNNGTIFKLTTSGKLLSYYAFPGGSGGALPFGALIQASDGNFYGTTYSGGFPPGSIYGTVFKMDQKGVVSILYSFDPFTDGVYPLAGLVQGTDGNLYGTLSYGGANNFGALFQITTNGTYKQLYSFSSSMGEYPVAALMQDTSGLFYGTAGQGGAFGFGSVFSLDMGLGPFVTFVRASGKVGQKAEILGQGLKGTTKVTFNGHLASSFTVVNDTYMAAVVPSGATTGPVVVATPTGKLTSNMHFRILK